MSRSNINVLSIVWVIPRLTTRDLGLTIGLTAIWLKKSHWWTMHKIVLSRFSLTGQPHSESNFSCKYVEKTSDDRCTLFLAARSFTPTTQVFSIYQKKKANLKFSLRPHRVQTLSPYLYSINVFFFFARPEQWQESDSSNIVARDWSLVSLVRLKSWLCYTKYSYVTIVASIDTK